MIGKLSSSTFEAIEKTIENIKNGDERNSFIVIDDDYDNPVCGIYPEQKLVVVVVIEDGRVNLSNLDRVSSITSAHGWFVAPTTNAYSAINENEGWRDVRNFIKLYVDKATSLVEHVTTNAIHHPGGAHLSSIFEFYELAAIRSCAHAFVANVGLDDVAHEYIDMKMAAIRYITPRARECFVTEIMKAVGF